MTDRCALVVEDEVIVRLYLAEHLRDAGITTVEAASGDQALEALRLNNLVAVVVTDFQMPGKTDGLALAREAKRINPSIKTILVSGAEIPAFGDEVDAFFPKPYDIAAVVERVASFMRRNSPLSPAVECA